MAKAVKIKLPKGSKELQSVSEKKTHFDYVNSNFAEKHYGKYLVGVNSNTSKSPHSRIYICHESSIEFMNSYLSEQLVLAHKKIVGKIHIVTNYPKYEKFIVRVLFKLIKSGKKEDYIRSFIKGFANVLSIWDENNCVPNSFDDIILKHIEIVSNEVKKGEYIRVFIVEITSFLRSIAKNSNKNIPDPNLFPYIKTNEIENNSISMIVHYQLDYYAKKEIENIMLLVNEYQKWMHELEEMGELFSLANLSKSYELNIELYGSNATSYNTTLRKIGKVLHGVDIRCWNKRKNDFYTYESDSDRQRHLELRELAKTGIDITIWDERMFSMWLKVICPNYPFEREISEQFILIWETPFDAWKMSYLKKLGLSSDYFDSRIIPIGKKIYPFYLFFLIRSGLNQDVLKDVKVYKDIDNKWKVGIDSGVGILIDGYKGRGNIQQSAIIRKGHEEERYLRFIVEWLTPTFERFGNRHLFQYLTDASTQGRNESRNFSSSALSKLRNSNDKNLFFNKYEIIDEILGDKGQYKQVRIKWIDHREIRKMANFSRYLEGLSEWERQQALGHRSFDTQIQYQQTSDWEHINNHKIATVQNSLVEFFKGNITSKDNQKLRVFETLLAGCSDPHNPTYNGASKLGHDEVCTNWRKCLTECDKSNVVPEIHGPVIYAWRDCMEQIKDEFLKIEDWEKEFIMDYEAANSVLNLFKEDVLNECKQNSPKYFNYVRNMIFSVQHKRKLKEA